jgi:hypothetical protein
MEHALVPAKEVEPDDYSFRVHDSIINLAPLGNIASASIGTASGHNYPGMPKPELVVSTGRGRSSFLCKLSRELYPVINKQYNVASAQAAWSVIKKPSSAKTKASMTSETRMENLIITSVIDDMGEEQSHLYSWSKDKLEELINSDFDPTAGASIAVSTFDGGSRIVQVLKNEVRVYDDGKFYIKFHTSPAAYQQCRGSLMDKIISRSIVHVHRYGRPFSGECQIGSVIGYNGYWECLFTVVILLPYQKSCAIVSIQSIFPVKCLRSCAQALNA